MSTQLMGATYFEFENMPVRLIATRKIPKIKTAGLAIEEVDAGKELTVSLWIAWELMEAGLARLAEDGVSDEEWTQIHYRERFQPLGKPLPLPDKFYSKAYLSFKQASKRSASDPSRLEGFKRVKGWYRDIIESRIGKVTRLASAEATAQTRSLQPEEAALYAELRELISSWRKKMRELGGE